MVVVVLGRILGRYPTYGEEETRGRERQSVEEEDWNWRD